MHTTPLPAARMPLPVLRALACKAALQTQHNRNAPEARAAYCSDGCGMQACKAKQALWTADMN